MSTLPRTAAALSFISDLAISGTRTLRPAFLVCPMGPPSYVPSTAETLPHPSTYLVFEHDLERPADDPSVHSRAEISGVTSGKFSRTMEGHGRVFGLKFQPGGLRPFLQTSVSTLTDRVVPAAEIFGRDILMLATQLRTLDSPEIMATIAKDYFARHLPERDTNAELSTLLVNTILHDPTILSVEIVSRRSGLSIRSLQRLFKEYVGVSPKWVIRRFRLHELLEHLHSGEAIDGARLALDLGYADRRILSTIFASSQVRPRPNIFVVPFEHELDQFASEHEGALLVPPAR